MITESRYVSLDRFLVALAEGWRFCRPDWHVGGIVAGPMAGGHGAWSCLMMREVAP